MHDLVIVGIPLIAILAGILFNRQDVGALRNELASLCSEMNSRFNHLENRLDSIQRDMREFYAEQAKHDVRISALEQQK